MGNSVTLPGRGMPSSLPWVGWKARKYETIGASQNTGIDIPITETARPATSPNDLGLMAPSAPMGAATSIHSAAAPNTSDAVTLSAGHRMLDTERICTYE